MCRAGCPTDDRAASVPGSLAQGPPGVAALEKADPALARPSGPGLFQTAARLRGAGDGEAVEVGERGWPGFAMRPPLPPRSNVQATPGREILRVKPRCTRAGANAPAKEAAGPSLQGPAAVARERGEDTGRCARDGG